MSGIVYLVQPVELIGTNRYKIGCSAKNDLSRCKNGYKNGTRYITIMECTEPFKIESQIKSVFTEKFMLIAGKEYFEGNETEMKTNFFEIVTNYKSSEKPNIRGVTCKLCSKEYGKLSSYRRHIPNCKGRKLVDEEPDNNDTGSESERVTCDTCKKTFANKYSLQRHNTGACKSSRLKQLLSNPNSVSILEKALDLAMSGNQTINNGNLTNNHGTMNVNNGAITNNIENNNSTNNTLNQTNNSNLTLHQYFHINPIC